MRDKNNFQQKLPQNMVQHLLQLQESQHKRGKIKSILKWTVIVHLGALQWKDRKKKQKKKKITSHNVIGTGDLGFNIFIKPLPS